MTDNCIAPRLGRTNQLAMAQRAAFALSVLLIALGTGVGRRRVERTFIQGSPGDQQGYDKLVLNTWWWMIGVGAAALAVGIVLRLGLHHRDRIIAVVCTLPCVFGGTFVVVWLLRLVTATALDTGWSDGRPLRDVDGKKILPRAFAAQSTAVAAAWIESARHEYSSIASFKHAAASLEAANAPRSLIARAQAASCDEYRHVKTCCVIASQLGARDVVVHGSVESLLEERSGLDDIESIAITALIDGVLGEGFASRRLELSAVHQTPFSDKLKVLAVDERLHADLGADIVVWCLQQRPSLADTLSAALRQIPSGAPSSPVVDSISDTDRRKAGICTSCDADHAWQDSITEAHLLLERLLTSATSPAVRLTHQI